MRELGKVKYDSEKYNDTNMLLYFQLGDPKMLDNSLTYLWGKDTADFPLLSLTAGQNSITTRVVVGAGDTQYQWAVQTRMRHTSRIRRILTGKVGNTYLPDIQVEMEDNWFIHQHTAIAPVSGAQYRIQSEGRANGGTGGYIYNFSLITKYAGNTPVDEDFVNGMYWGLGASSIPASKSNGNRNNAQSPVMATNQYGYYRFSEHIAGNVDNMILNIEFDLEGGGTTKYWMPYQMKQFELRRRIVLEEDLWYSEYNRDAQGKIELIDEETGEAIPKGAGVRQILQSVGNLESFARLSVPMIERTVNRIFENRLDEPVKEIVVYCGKGFWKQWDAAFKREARLNNYFVELGKQEIQSGGEYLSYGAYFRQYTTIYGQTITLKLCNVFDHGVRAQMDRQNGRMIDGLPVTSYTGVFLDHTRQGDGERNIQYIVEQGREYKVGIYKGMANLPAEWRVMDEKIISDRRDVATYEVIGSQGINLRNPTTSFWWELAA